MENSIIQKHGEVNEKMHGLSLFSGIGGIDVALSEYISPIAYCEIEPYCQSVLLQRMQAGDLPKAPVWDDVRSLKCAFPHGLIDIIYGGFPCQNISIAGRGEGLAGKQSGLFFEIMRLAKEIKPKFLFLENVPAITSRGGLRVVREITSLGYDCRWCVISAAGVGALHRRERWFLLANASTKPSGTRGISGFISHEEWRKGKDGRKSIQPEDGQTCTNNTQQSSKDVANSKSTRLEGFGRDTERQKEEQSESSLCSENNCNTDSITSEQTNTRSKSKHTEWEARGEHSRLYRPFKSRDDWQATVSDVCRVTDGLPTELDFLKKIGFINEKIDFEKTNTKNDFIGRKVLRVMWENRELATSSRGLYFRKLQYCLSEMSYEFTFKGENLGSWFQEGNEMCGLWEKFYTETEQTKQAVWEFKLLKHLGKEMCRKKMEEKYQTDRLKSLGNAVVPVQVRKAWEILFTGKG